MGSSWQNRFQGIRPGGRAYKLPDTIQKQCAVPANETSPAKKQDERAQLTISLNRQGELPFREGDEVAVTVQNMQRKIHPPLIVDLFAFHVDNRHSIAKRLKLSRNGVNSLSLLQLKDDNIGNLAGRWQLYGVANEKLCCNCSFTIRPTEAWLLRTVRIIDFSLYESLGKRRRGRGNRGNQQSRPLQRLTTQSKKVDFRLKLAYPHGLAGMLAELVVTLSDEEGNTLFQTAQELGDISPCEIFEQSIPLVEGRRKLPCGNYELRLFLNSVELRRIQYPCENPNLFTEEGELSEEGRQLVIAGVTITRD